MAAEIEPAEDAYARGFEDGRAEARVLREALEFYEDERAYEMEGPLSQPVLRDGGARARAALASSSVTEPEQAASSSEEGERAECLSRGRDVVAALAAYRRVEDGRWIKGAPSHLLAAFLSEMEADGWHFLDISALRELLTSDEAVEAAAQWFVEASCWPTGPHEADRENARELLAAVADRLENSTEDGCPS